MQYLKLWGLNKVNYTVSEEDLKNTLVAYLESEREDELSAIMKISDFVYDPRWEFSGIVSGQKKLYLSLRVPVVYKKVIEEKKDLLTKMTEEIYQDDDDYYYLGISTVGVKPVRTQEIEFETKHYILDKDSVYSNFFQFITTNQDIDAIQRKYLFEACDCANNHDLLAASVMLGASAELLLIQLCEAYEKYVDNHKNSQDEVDAYRRKVVNAKCANDRLTEFLKRANSNAPVFNSLGLENLQLAFSFLDIIRKVRNDGGHPTGNSVPEEEFKVLIGNYQHYLPILLNAINELPNR